MSDIKEIKNEEDEVVLGDKISSEYRAKTNFKDSAEFRMVIYVVPVALVLAVITYFLSKL